MDSAPHLDQNHEKDQTSIAQTLSAVRDICQRLEKWAMRDLADLHVSCSVLDLIQYCQATLEQCESQLVNQKPIQQSELVQEQVQRSPGAHESEPNKSSTQTLEMLLAECKLRTQQAAKLLDNKLRHLAEEKPIREEVARADVYRFFAAAKAIRNNTKADSDSLYLSETRSRVKRAVVSDLFPQLNAFGSELLSISESRNARNHSADNPFPEELQVQEILLKFMSLSANWAEHLRTITDPLNVRTFRTSCEVPYKRVVEVAEARGSFGIVYKAKDMYTQKTVAIKQLKMMYSSKQQATVRQELSMLGICNHPNVVKLLDAYQIHGNPYAFHLVMQPWAPYTLEAFLHESTSERRNSAPWFTQGDYKTERKVVRILRGLADGMGYLHDKSIKHKDLKPANILLRDTGPSGIQPVIADLGISKIFRDGDWTDYNQSTYIYLALEQVKSTGSTLRSDIWQLGCCFALLLAVFRRGSLGCWHLWNSFTEYDRSCNIALEASSFLRTFEILCGDGSVSQRRAHWLTTAMLCLEPELRLDIKTVKSELADI